MLELGLEDLNRTSSKTGGYLTMSLWHIGNESHLSHILSTSRGRVPQISGTSSMDVDGIGLSLIPKKRWYHLLF